MSTHSIDLGSDAIERLSPLEEKFERIRKGAGFVLAPIVFLAIYFAPFAGMTKPAWDDKSLPKTSAAFHAAPQAMLLIPVHNQQAHRLAAIMATTAVLWICESLPMTVTALLAAATCIMMGVGTSREVFSQFASYITFLFIGSFILARAVFIHGLDRRFAYGILANPWVGGRPERILFGFGLATAFMSAWISNTASTAMMFAIGMSILSVFFREGGPGGTKVSPRFATGLMLMTSFAASIGGLCTPIGSPPNMIGINQLAKEGVTITFFQWSMIGFPLVSVLFLILYFYMNYFCKAGVAEIQGGAEFLRERRNSLGPWTTSQKSTMFAFGVTVVLWIFPGIVYLALGESSPFYKGLKEPLNEGVVAILGACLLFLLPGDRDGRAINWSEASQIDWGIVLLYGGGFALGSLMESTGLAAAIGRSMTTWLPLDGEFAILVFATTIAVIVSEATSNTASAQIIVPVVIAVAKQAGVNPIVPALGATFGASLGFMLPVSTPCNAIVYGSGYVPLTRMIRYGLLLDVAGIVVVISMMHFLLPLAGLKG